MPRRRRGRRSPDGTRWPIGTDADHADALVYLLGGALHEHRNAVQLRATELRLITRNTDTAKDLPAAVEDGSRNSDYPRIELSERDDKSRASYLCSPPLVNTELSVDMPGTVFRSA